MKRTIIFLLTLTAFALQSSTHKPSSSFRTGKDYALFFAINDYDHWQDLTQPISDVESIAKDLRDLYAFETEIIRNPDRTTILTTIEKYRAKTYAADAQLLIFFSGHGDFDESTKQGFFIPKGGRKVVEFGDSYLEYQFLKQRIASLPCNHIILALDACYSGTANESIAMRGAPGSRPGTNAEAQRQQYISSSLQYKSRFMLTSGAKVRTPDKSAFVAKFLEVLRGQGGADGLVNSSELFGNLTTAVPKPVISTFGDHEPGAEFLFIGKNIPAGTSIVPDKRTQSGTTTSQGGTNEVSSDGFVLVKGGAFTMGCTKEQQDCGKDEKPVHQVTLNDFYISPYEVTLRQWKQVMGSKPSRNDGKKQGKPISKATGEKVPSDASTAKRDNRSDFSEPEEDCDDCPVEYVSWNQAQDFLQKINEQNPGLNYRLPTEAEWEYAARGGNQSKGYQYAGGNEISVLAWYSGNAGGKMRPVGKKQPNELGLYDMSGNIQELCSDLYGEDYYKKSPASNPPGPASNPVNYYVIRGGAWSHGPESCRTANRSFHSGGVGYGATGFRLARSK